MNLVQYGKSRLGDNWEESLEDSKDGKCFSNLILVITFLSYFCYLCSYNYNFIDNHCS